MNEGFWVGLLITSPLFIFLIALIVDWEIKERRQEWSFWRVAEYCNDCGTARKWDWQPWGEGVHNCCPECGSRNVTYETSRWLMSGYYDYVRLETKGLTNKQNTV